MSKKVTLHVTGPTAWDDNSPLTAAQFKGFAVIVDGKDAVEFPASLATDNEYVFEISELVDPAVTANHKVTVRTLALNNDGTVVQSVDSPSVDFKTVAPDTRVPQPPKAVTVSVT